MRAMSGSVVVLQLGSVYVCGPSYHQRLYGCHWSGLPSGTMMTSGPMLPLRTMSGFLILSQPRSTLMFKVCVTTQGRGNVPGLGFCLRLHCCPSTVISWPFPSPGHHTQKNWPLPSPAAVLLRADLTPHLGSKVQLALEAGARVSQHCQGLQSRELAPPLPGQKAGGLVLVVPKLPG